MAGIFDSTTLKIWHGGAFKNGRNGDLIYVGGNAKTFEIDPDVLYTTENGLRKVENDDTVREMIELMKNSRCLEVYVLHGLDVPALTPPSGKESLVWRSVYNEESEDSGEFEEEELNATNDGDEGLKQINGSDSEDLDELEFEEDDEEILDDELQYQSNSGDEEYILARQRVRDTTAKLVDNAKQIQKQAAKGQNIPDQGEAGEPSTVESGFQSEYEDGEEEIHTPPNSGDEALDDRRKRRSGLLASNFTDFARFKWKVGQNFATRGDFKNAVAKYGILQGRDVHFTVGNKHRQQRLGVKCIESCPFYVYESWSSRRATVVVKTVKGEHSCQRNMKRNRQLKSTWVADQFLEVLKNRPHWPASEIQECVRKAYKMLVSKDFPYKVKYAAHKKLHGSMHDHCNKLGGYMEALKASSPATYMELVTETEKQELPPIFKRLFISFDGLKEGWKLGCRRVLAVDACFIKTFLGGQLLSAVGRDSNDQMFPGQ
ncbi:putative Xaa-Pro aminopeptidase PEPP [Bienertia sinuspersici]